ncbi:MAG: SLC13 family permease [Evtepia gabavorous]
MLSQILALIIAIVLFSALLQGKYPRYLLTLAAGGAMVLVVLLGTMGSPAAALEALSVDSFVKPQFWFAHGGVTEFNVGINWSTILFLAGMMIMVEAMSEAGFFDWVCLRLAKALGFRPMPLMLSFMVLAALLSMFVDSITVVLFLVVATARLAHFLRFDPVPMIIGEIFAANLGGAATMSGDPPNIIIGTSLGLSFWDFLRNNGVICLIGLVLVLVYFYLCFRSKSRGEAAVAPELWEIDPNDAIPSRRRFLARVSIFGVVILLIATHTLTGLTMPTIGVLAAAVTLVSTKTPQNLVRQMDWKILGFIIGLFLTVSGLEQTGVLDGMAQFLAALGGDHADQMVVVLIWFTAIVSAFVDNIPMATVMVPVLLSLAEPWAWTCIPTWWCPKARTSAALPRLSARQRHRGGAGGQGGASHLLETLLQVCHARCSSGAGGEHGADPGPSLTGGQAGDHQLGTVVQANGRNAVAQAPADNEAGGALNIHTGVVEGKQTLAGGDDPAQKGKAHLAPMGVAAEDQVHGVSRVDPHQFRPVGQEDGVGGGRWQKAPQLGRDQLRRGTGKPPLLVEAGVGQPQQGDGFPVPAQGDGPVFQDDHAGVLQPGFEGRILRQLASWLPGTK